MSTRLHESFDIINAVMQYIAAANADFLSPVVA